MRHVLLLGGPPGAGKTTVARRLARRHGLRLYQADTRTWVHRDRALAAGDGAAQAWEALTPAERTSLPPEDFLRLSLHHQRGAMVLDDLRALPRSPLVVAEGTPVPVSAVGSGLVDRGRALWLLPTTALQDERLTHAGLSPRVVEAYRLLRSVIEAEARAADVPVLWLDGSLGLTSVTRAAEVHFGDALEAGPMASSRSERRALLREANLDVVAQVRGYHARAGTEPIADAVEQVFVCECGARDCEQDVVATVGEASAARVFAAGHG